MVSLQVQVADRNKWDTGGQVLPLLCAQQDKRKNTNDWLILTALSLWTLLVFQRKLQSEKQSPGKIQRVKFRVRTGRQHFGSATCTGHCNHNDPKKHHGVDLRTENQLVQGRPTLNGSYYDTFYYYYCHWGELVIVVKIHGNNSHIISCHFLFVSVPLRKTPFIFITWDSITNHYLSYFEMQK